MDYLIGIVSSDMPLGEGAVNLFVQHRFANSVGYFIHSALRNVLPKLPKADFSKIFSNFFAVGVPLVGSTQ